jgi:hypothetical protein
MDQLVFPPFDYRIIEKNNKTYIFDIIRKKNIIITPEEWVRQHLVHFLIMHMNYPKSLISIEDGLKVNRMQKRSDIVVYQRSGSVFMIIECKSYKVKLDQKAMDQLSNYNQKYKAKYLSITNGMQVYICEMDYSKKSSQFINEFPEFT